MSNFSLQQLTEGIRQRHLGSQNNQLIEKWSRTGLLRGLTEVRRENMARLLENQASQVLREASSAGTGGASPIASGDLRGFTNIAFPIVRRVFGGLIANDLVSIQPMSLPSGLLFYLDYTVGGDQGASALGGSVGGALNRANDSLYNNPRGAGVRSGSLGTGGKADLVGTSVSRHVHNTGRNGPRFGHDSAADLTHIFTLDADGAVTRVTDDTTLASVATTGKSGRLLQFDPQITAKIDAGEETYCFALLPWNTDNFAGIDDTMLKEVALIEEEAATGFEFVGEDVQGGKSLNVKRLNQLVKITAGASENFGGELSAAKIQTLTELRGPAPALGAADAGGATSDVALLMVLRTDGVAITAADLVGGANFHLSLSYVRASALDSGAGAADTLVVPAFESNFGAGGSPGNPAPVIPEIDIKIEAVPVVAETRKLRARWSPELAQDLNAYHSLDAEVELTQILSEQIALEIDREILNDLLSQASAANYYWSRAPGVFVNKLTGVEAKASDSLAGGPSFRGTVREWYETLVETIIDVGNEIHRKTLRGSANFIVVGPDVATIIEASVFYKPSYSLDGDGQVQQPVVLGAEQVGQLSNRFTVYKDPYFPRNKVLVGYKGGSYLETGYVYAPYVPLIVTPTIFQPEDFTPRKGVMTRYGKKMVRSDFYGTVTCRDMNVI